MKTQTVALLVIVALLLASTVALAQSGGPRAGYVVQQAALSGGTYRLTSPTWSLSGAASGGRYSLLGPAALSGGRCCCTWLPIVMRR